MHKKIYVPRKIEVGEKTFRLFLRRVELSWGKWEEWLLVLSLEPAPAAKFSAQPANALSKQITNSILYHIRNATDAYVAVFVTELIENW